MHARVGHYPELLTRTQKRIWLVDPPADPVVGASDVLTWNPLKTGGADLDAAYDEILERTEAGLTFDDRWRPTA